VRVDLSGQVALVTGAAQGIGKAIADMLAENGARVVYSDRDAAKLAQTAGSHDHIVLDVTDREAIPRVVSTVVARHGGLDILVNNAGIGVRAADRRTIDEFPVEAWDEMIAIDLTGVFLMSRAGAAAMKRAGRGGSIVNIASVLGLIPMRLQSPYVAAKAAVVNLTRSMALELAPANIRVNAIAPGSTATEGWARWIKDPTSDALDLHQRLMSHIPLRRPAETREIAHGALFLAAPESAYITGHCLPIDGGWTAGFARDS
jgi:NAD(P)-dependent dehydrogenase (short-subunit alcohol dehydrogenase family)